MKPYQEVCNDLLIIMKIHNSWYYCFTNPLDIGTLSHCHDDAKAKHVSQYLED